MSNKYHGRSISNISRDESTDRDTREPSWFNDFVTNLEKGAAKPRSQDHSLFDQINNILGNKSKYSNVEEAVLDMQKRTGLYDILQKKKASEQSKKDPEIFSDIPAMKHFIDNYVEDRPGTAIDAVVHDLLKIQHIKSKLPNNDDVGEDVRHYINKKILESKLQHPNNTEEDMQIGKLDLSVDDNITDDNDPFSGCEPNSDSK